jgi:uncharacterized membrane protein YdjX (TVP38/TMEM64 family)
MSLLLLLTLLPLVVTRGFAIHSPHLQRITHFQAQNNKRIPYNKNAATDAVLDQIIARAAAGGGRNDDAKLTRRQMSTADEVPSRSIRKRTIAISAIIAALVATLGYEYRVPLASAFNKEALQQRVLNLLHSFHGDWKGVVLYSSGMAVWELFGMSTIPVETAAGMVFGFKIGFLASATGKLVGAFAGYMLGRTVLSGFIGEKLSKNKTIQLIHDHVNQNPIKVAMLLRYSLLPEFVKNCGASLFPPIQPWMFVLSIVFHGWMYTACWTYLGVDTAARLETPGLPVNRLAQFAVAWATVVGMVLTPIIMAWWIRDMQTSELNVMDENDKNKNNKS